MKVILLQDIRGLGKRFDTKDVNDGYARNFLVPKKLATPLDKEGLKLKTAMEAGERLRLSEIKSYIQETLEKPIEFKLKIGESGEVFGSIKKDDIEKTLEQRGWKNAKAEIKEPLKKVGENEILVNFGRGIKEKVKVIISGH